MKLRALGALEAAMSGFTHVATIDYTDIVGNAALTGSKAIYPESGTVGACVLIDRVVTKVTTPFEGCDTLGLTLGDGATPTKFTATHSMKNAANSVYGLQAATAPGDVLSSSALTAYFTATNNNLTALTAGSVDVYFREVDLLKI